MSSEGGPELGVVCRNCGSEVSAYVTECPYCGQRLRKSAPKLERRGGNLERKQTLAERIRGSRQRGTTRSNAAAAHSRWELERDLGRPWGTLALGLIGSIMVVVQRAGGFSPYQVGAVVADPGNELWRLVSANFVYEDIGYMFAVLLGLAIVGPSLERRIGTVGVLTYALAGGGLANGAAVVAAAGLGLDDPVVAAGGNGMVLFLAAALAAFRSAEVRANADDQWDQIGFAIVVAAVAALALVETYANPVVAVVGALSGWGAGALAVRAQRRGA